MNIKNLLIAVAAGIALVVVTGCGSGQQDNREQAEAICVDPVSNNRVDDDYCDEDDDDYHPGYGYFFFMPGMHIPGMGQSASHGSRTQPPNTRANFGGFNKTGGSYTKPSPPKQNSTAPKVNINKPSSGSSSRVNSGSTSSRSGGGGSVSSGGRGR